MKSSRLHDDGLHRCPWPGEYPLYMAYHDTEWGVPEYDDRALFEKLILDGFQAGLSWITILRKRDNFRKAFDDFVPAKIARYGDKKVAELMDDAGIVRNRAKIEGTIATPAGVNPQSVQLTILPVLGPLGGGALNLGMLGGTTSARAGRSGSAGVGRGRT